MNPTVFTNPRRDNRATAEAEGRAKIFWGEEPSDVINFLMLHGIPAGEALELVNDFVRERTEVVRGIGIKKTVMGVLLTPVPFVAWFMIDPKNTMYAYLLALPVGLGAFGVWNLLKGLVMVVSPKSEPGDVAGR